MTNPDERGSLRIAPKVVERVADFASRTVDGVTTSGSNVSQALGRSYPRINAEVAGQRAVLDIEIASVWPVEIPSLVTNVARVVKEQLKFCADVDVDRIHVFVGHVDRVAPQAKARVQ